MTLLTWIYWNPHREIFTLPFIHHPIGWYGLFFVAGLMIGYFILIHLFTTMFSHVKPLYPRDFPNLKKLLQCKALHNLTKNKLATDPVLILKGINDKGLSRHDIQQLDTGLVYSAKELGTLLADKMLWFIILGILIGARLGHVFFYDWAYYQMHPEKILKIWEGGLASHGGTIGVMLGLILYKKLILNKFPELTVVRLFDLVVIPTALVAFFIRLGNFFNQEITGVQTNVPWAVIFGAPAEGSPFTPRHPVQLYEAFAYLLIFIFLLMLWRVKRNELKAGLITGLFFTLVFSSRFFIEYWKMPQNGIFDDALIQTGQLLSLPFIFLGIGLILWSIFSPPTKNNTLQF